MKGGGGDEEMKSEKKTKMADSAFVKNSDNIIEHTSTAVLHGHNLLHDKEVFNCTLQQL